MSKKIRDKLLFSIQLLFSNLYNIFFELFHYQIKYKTPIFFNNSQSNDSLCIWNDNEIELIHKLSTSHHKNFLQWNVIRKTMFFNNHNICIPEYRYLKKSTNWNKTWKDNLFDPTYGWPLRSFFRLGTSYNSFHHAYHIQRYLDFLENDEINNFEYIFEFGGGYGNLCRIFYNIGFQNKYIIFDLPQFTVLQNSYLTNTIPNKSFACYSDFSILSNEISKISNKKVLFIATWSLSESPLQLRENLMQLFSGCAHFIVAYQKEVLDIDNYLYFSNTFQKYFSNIIWKNEEIGHIPNSYYLFGKPIG